MIRKIYNISVGIISLLVSSCQSLIFDGKAPQNPEERKYSIIFHYHTKIDDITKDDFFKFIENFGVVYLYLALGEHKTFSPDMGKVIDGSNVLNTEEVNGQFVTHHYKIYENKSKGYIRWISNPSEVILRKWNFKIQMATILELTFSEGEYRTELSLVFGSKKDLDSSLKNKVQENWDVHNTREMGNGKIILEYLKKSGQLEQDPKTWNIEPILGTLLK